ncbi:O-antigen/teichoic acid export membrane protein [Palleronia aestuarii]|uniref:O-antigen/teichoic acid export membrane protein n=1 Tax=Palleronia aestuarii TaxID=568105 RepID=A0A2W7PVB3_9RHOB|nr:oligosaccharide flippase family protein [Palleronia aestuarii]PZX13459.1 O-antigen/teichoic acid export membrane protein [Palleronia aestuarii]
MAMMDPLRRRLSGNGLSARALRGTGAALLSAFSENGLRLVSNLVLTRLLFPEAFGVMALIQVILLGLTLFSNIGLQASVMQNPRGDDPDFLNTAWTLQAIRGVLLWLTVCLFAVPAAHFYDEPILAYALPVAGFSLVIKGVFPTKLLTAQRHLMLGRVAFLTIVAQVVNLVALSLLAWLTGSVWALVFGLLISPTVSLALYTRYMPGMRNHFRLERQSVSEMVNFGKYLFFSTIATYVLNQSDRAVLGAHIPTDLLGIYAIGYTLATLPWMLAQKVAGMVVFPLYRMRHPSESAENRARIFRSRRLVVASALGLVATMTFLGPWIVSLLYDDRYILAGPIAVLLAACYVPPIVLIGLMNAALAQGNSLALLVVNVATAICQITILLLGVQAFGIPGAAIAIGAAPLLTYPITVHYMRRHGNWDAVGDAALFAAGFAISATAIWLHWDGIARLFTQ